MEIRSSEEVLENIMSCANELLAIQLQKKGLDEDIKALKQTWKEEGVAVGKVTKVLGKLKARAKMTESDKLEEDIIEEKLAGNEDIQDSIAMLNE